MGTAGRVTAKDRDSPDIAITGIHCGDLHCGDPGGLGPSAGIGEARSRSSPEADIENSSKPGNPTGRPVSNSADHFRCTTADANDPGSGDRRTDGRVPGFYPGILWLVCFDGTKRSEGSGLGRDRWCRRRGSTARAVPYLAAGDGKLDCPWASDREKSLVLERLCHTREIFQLLNRRTVDVG